MLLLIATFAFAGYGDPVDGLPSLDERRLFVWTNAARIEPGAFEDAYAEGGCSFDGDFSEDEKTPKNPVAWNADLNEAARFHSDDMNTNNHFAHASSDGTPFGQRVARFYDGGPAGENIAYGGRINPYYSVFSMWMCSTTGHRGNIMSNRWEELGTGISGVYYTQNFGDSNIELPGISMGAHWEEGDMLVFRSDAFDVGGQAPARVEVVINGVPATMNVEYGDPDRGIYKTTRNAAQVVDTEMPGCTEYWFQATWGDPESETARVERFPETGSYAFGECTYTDADAQWINRQLQPEEPGGCSTVAAPMGLAWLGGLAGLVVVGRRRRG